MVPTASSNMHELLEVKEVQWSSRDVFVFLPRFKLECKFSLREYVWRMCMLL